MIISIIKGVGWSVLSTTTGRVVLGVTALFVAWQIDRAWQRSAGAARVVEKSVEAGKQINDRNRQVRRQAQAPGAFKRLLADSCRDC